MMLTRQCFLFVSFWGFHCRMVISGVTVCGWLATSSFSRRFVKSWMDVFSSVPLPNIAEGRSMENPQGL
jgi:hypothetical protein